MRQDRTITPCGPQPFARVDGQGINVATLSDAVAKILDRLDQGLGFTLFTLNLDHLDKRRTDPAFRAAYARATFVTADGAPVVALARRQGAVLSRSTGADLIEPLCRAASVSKIPIYLFGSSQEVLARAAAELRRRCPGFEVRGTEAPPWGFEPDSDDADAAGRRIAASGARLCFVALGAPKQEIFADRMAQLTPGVGYLCVGAGLDFLGGGQNRAPVLAQRLNLEWFWRMAGNPRRLGLRYARCAVLFARLLLSADRPSADRPVVDQAGATQPGRGQNPGLILGSALQAPQVARRPHLEIIHTLEPRLQQSRAPRRLHLRDVSAAR